MRIRFLALALLALLAPTAAWSQTSVYMCVELTTGIDRCQHVSVANPLPVSGTFTPSGSSPEFTPVAAATATATKGVLNGCQYDSTQKTLTDGQQSATSCSPRGAFFVATGADSFTIANTTFGATFPTTPTIAAGSGVVPAPSSESLAAIAHSTSVTAAESCRVLKASAGNLYSVRVSIAATTGYVMVFDATSAPVDGAVTTLAFPAVRVVSDGTSGWYADDFNPPMRMATGITVCFSSTGPFSKTASATAAIEGQVQ